MTYIDPSDPPWPAEIVRTEAWLVAQVAERAAQYRILQAWAEAWALSDRDQILRRYLLLDCGTMHIGFDAWDLGYDLTAEQSTAIARYLSRRRISPRARTVARECRKLARVHPDVVRAPSG